MTTHKPVPCVVCKRPIYTQSSRRRYCTDPKCQRALNAASRERAYRRDIQRLRAARGVK